MSVMHMIQLPTALALSLHSLDAAAVWLLLLLLPLSVCSWRLHGGQYLALLKTGCETTVCIGFVRATLVDYSTV